MSSEDEERKKQCREERIEAMQIFYQREYEKFKSKVGGWIINAFIIAIFLAFMKLFFITDSAQKALIEAQTIFGR